MPLSSAWELYEALAASRLLDEAQLAKVEARLSADQRTAPFLLAEELVERGLVNSWQASQLLEGRRLFVLGPFRLVDLVGQGGMGAVYKARHDQTGEVYALKVLADELVDKPESVARFRREARAASMLNHPNVVRAHECGNEGPTHYLAMELVEGKDLNEWVTKFGRLPIAWACECVRQAAIGLQHAHEQGMVHRDIKPGNLLIVASDFATPPVVKILDMGLARFGSHDAEEGDAPTNLTQTGMILGTPDYIAPEQARDTRLADIRSDIYSLGCTLFKLLTGEVPFEGTSAMQKLVARTRKDAPHVRTIRKDTPQVLDDILAKMLAREPAERFQTPREVAEALAPFAAGVGVADEAASDTPSTALPPQAMEDFFAELKEKARPDDRTVLHLASARTPPPAASPLLDASTAETDEPAVPRRFPWRAVAAVMIGAMTLTLLAGGVSWWLSRPTMLVIDWPLDQRPHSLLVAEGSSAALDGYYEGFATEDLGRPGALAGPGASANFDGRDNRVVVPDSARLDLTGDMTVEFWMNKSGESVEWSRMVGKGDRKNRTFGVWDDIGAKRGVFFQQYQEDGQRGLNVVSKTRLAVGQWYHIAATVSGDVDAIYVNGKLEGSGKRKELASGSTEPLTFGAADFHSPYHGLLDEVSLYQSALSADRIAAHYKAGESGVVAYRKAVNADKPIGHWRLDDTTTSPARLLIDGRRIAVTDANPIEVPVEPGRRRVRIDRRGYEPFDVTTDAGRGSREQLAVAFVPLAIDAAKPPSAWQGGQVTRAWHAKRQPGQVERAEALAALAEKVNASRSKDQTELRAEAIEFIRRWPATDEAVSAAGMLRRLADPLDALPLNGHADGTSRPEEGPIVRLLGDRRLHHLGQVYSLAFSPDGQTLACADLRKEIDLWDLDTGARRRTLVGHAQGVYSLAWRPGGRFLASAAGGTPGELRLWDTETGQTAASVLAHSGAVHAVAFTADGNRLASGGFDGRVILWDVADDQMRLRRTIVLSKTAVTGLAFSPDGATLAVSSRPGPDVVRYDVRGSAPVALPPLTGLTAQVESVAWSPDGRLLAATSTDRTVRLWKMTDEPPSEVWTSPKHEGAVYTAAFSADSRLLATAAWTENAGVRLWKADSGEPVHTFTGHIEGVVRLAFAPVGNRLASGGRDHRLHVWDTERLAEHLPPSGQFGNVTSAAFGPDERTLAAGSTDRTVALYDPLSGEQRHRLTGHTDEVLCVAWRPDGQHVASGGADRTVRIWNVDDGKQTGELTGFASAVSALAYSQDSNSLFTLADEGGVMRWDLSADPPRCEPLLAAGLGGGAGLTMLADGSGLAAVGRNDREVRRWNLESGKAELIFPLEGTTGFRAVAFAPDGTAISAGANNGLIHRWRLPLGRPLAPLGGHANVASLAYSPDGQWIASGGYNDGELRLWHADGEHMRQLYTLAPAVAGPVAAVSFSPSSRYLAAAHPEGGLALLRVAVADGPLPFAKPRKAVPIVALDALDPRKLPGIGPATADAGPVVARLGDHRLAHWHYSDGSFAGAPAFSPDGALLASGGSDGIVRLWDAATGESIRTMAHQAQTVDTVLFAPGGGTLITGGYNALIQVYDMPSGRELLALGGHTAGLDSLALSADGRTLVSGSYGNEAMICDLPAGNQRFKLTGHKNPTHGVALHPDGRTAATASHDGFVKLWDVATGEPRTTLASPGLAMHSIAFSPDGQTLVAGATNGMLRVWRPFDPAPEFELGPWHAIGPFESTDFQAAHPPEEAIDLAAEYPAFEGNVRWRELDLTAGEQIDLRTKFDPSNDCCGYLHQRIECPRAQRVAISLGSDDQVAVWLNGKPLHRFDAGRGIVFDQDHVTLDLRDGANDLLIKVGNLNDAWLFQYRFGQDAARTVTGHSQTVTSVAFSPDGGRVLTASNDGTARLWDMATWRTSAVLRGHVGQVTSAVYSVDGRTIATSGSDSTVRLWDAATAQERWARKGHAGEVIGLFVDLQGDGAITAGSDGTVRWWNLGGVETRAAVRAHEGRLLAADRSPDGELIATGGDDGVVRIWNAADGALRHEIRGHAGAIRHIAFHPAGRALATCGYDGTTRIWSTVDGVELIAPDGLIWGRENCLAFSPPGDRLIVGGAAGSTRTIDLRSGQEERAQSWDETSDVLAVAWRPDGKQVAVGLQNFWIRLGAADGSGRTLKLEGHGHHVISLSYSPDGRTLASGSRDGTVRLWNTDDGIERQVFRLAPVLGAVRVRFCPDGRHLAVACGDGTSIVLRIGLPDARPETQPEEPQRREQLAAAMAEVDTLSSGTATDKQLATLRTRLDGYRRRWQATPEAAQAAALLHRVPGPLDRLNMMNAPRLDLAPAAGPVVAMVGENRLAHGSDWIGGVDFSPDGGTLFTCGADMDANAWDVATGALRRRFQGHTQATRRLAVSPDGGLLATASFDDTVRLWDSRTGSHLRTLGDNRGGLNAIAFDATGERLASGGSGALRIWDVPTGRILHELKGHSKPVLMVDFSPDGRLLASSGEDRTVRIWNTTTGKAEKSLNVHQANVTALAFHPDGGLLASGDHTGTIKLWNPADWSEVRTLEYPARPIECVAWRPDGTLLASVHHGGFLRLWVPQSGAVRDTRVLERDPPFAVAFSPDGDTLATGGYGLAARLWDVDTGAERLPRSGHLGVVFAAALDLSGTLLATAGQDGTVRLWDTAKGTQRAVLTGHDGPVLDLALSPNGKALATAGQDGTVRLWETADGRQRPALIGHRTAVTGVDFSADGRTIVSGGDITVRLWDAASGLARGILGGTQDGVNAVAISPDGGTVAAQAGNELLIWNANDRRLLRRIKQPNGPCSALGFSLDGRTIYCAAGAEIIGWEVATGERVRSFGGHGRQLTSIDVLTDGRTLVSASHDATIRLWDIPTGRLRQTFDLAHGAWRTRARPTADGRHLAVASGDGTAMVLRIAPDPPAIVEPPDVAASEPSPGPLDALPPPTSAVGLPLESPVVAQLGDQRLRHWRTINKVAFAPDGTWLAAADGDWDDWQQPGEVRLWDTASGEMKSALRGTPSRVLSMAISPDGARIVTGDSSFRVRLWNVASGQEERAWEFPSQHVYGVAFRPNGLEVAAGGDSEELVVWNIETGNESHRLKGITGQIGGLAYSGDGRWLATAEGAWGGPAKPNVVRVWDADSLKPRATLKGHQAMVMGVAFLPDGNRLATSGHDRTVRIWDIATSKQVLELAGHTDIVYSVTVDPGGERLASASWDGSVRVWEAATGRLLHVFAGRDGWAQTAAFSPDGSRLAVGGTGRRVHLWDLNSGEEAEFSQGPAGFAQCTAALGDGARVVSGHEPGNLYLWDVASGQGRALSPKHPTTVRAVAALPGHGAFASGGGNGEVRIWDEQTGELLRSLAGHGGEVMGLCLGGDGQTLASCGSEGLVKLWDAAMGLELVTVAAPTVLRAVALSRDGRLVAAGGDDGLLYVWRATDGADLAAVVVHTAHVTSLAFSADGGKLFSASDDGNLHGWDTAAFDTGVSRLRPPVQITRNVDRFEPVEAKYVRFTALATNSLSPCLEELEVYTAGAKRTNVAAQKRGGRASASGEMDAAHAVGKVNDGRHEEGSRWAGDKPGEGWVQIELAEPAVIDRVVWCRDRSGRRTDHFPTQYRIEVALKPGQWKTVATSADRKMYIAGAAPVTDQKLLNLPAAQGPDVERGLIASLAKPRYTLRAHPPGILSVAVSPDGGQLATSGRDGIARLWHLHSPPPPRPIRWYQFADGPRRIAQAVFTPDGRHLLTAAADGTLRIVRPAASAPKLLIRCGLEPDEEAAIRAPGFDYELLSGTRFTSPHFGPHPHCWYGVSGFQFNVRVPAGTTGTLWLFQIDPDSLERRQRILVEGREIKDSAPPQAGEWVRVPVTAEDSADGIVPVEFINSRPDGSINAVVSLVAFTVE